MNAKMCSAAVLGALVAAGLAGSADAATKRMKSQQVRVTGYPAGQFYIAPGDSVASIRRAYPVDPNPPSFRQQYNLRGRMMQEFRN
jgi:hypothetical protein